MNLKRALPVVVLSLMAPSLGLSNGMDSVVKIDTGLLAGSGTLVRAYKGIPYAEAPTGKLRWQPPQPAKPWKGIRVARNYAPNCPQAPLLTGPQSEDCLALNVWTPAKTSNAKLPVMVWIHGGGFAIGASSQTAYDGEPLASQGVLLVSINYRLGIFGFMAHPALSQESPRGVSGNYGLLDMVAALGWVKRNIAAFGGDPDNVTIFGESAGGTAVCLLLVMPQSEGLFHRVIAESAWGINTPTSHLKESWYGRVSGEQFGLKAGDDLTAIRSKSIADLLKIAGMPMADADSYLPVVDGFVVPDDPARLFAAGKFHKVGLIAGTNADEGTLLGGPPVASLESFRKYAEKQFPGQADTLLAAYPAASDATAHAAAVKVSGDFQFLQGTRTVLRAVAKVSPQTFQYYFTRVNGTGRRIHWGSYHASEIPYVFGTLPDSVYGTQQSLFGDFSVGPDDYTDHDAEISQLMSAAWVRFAKTGNPNGPGLPQWPAFKEGDESYLEFGDQIVMHQGLRAKELDTLSALQAHRAKQ